ncbi:hypothetical protein ABK040_000265 [Willaertia magna]
MVGIDWIGNSLCSFFSNGFWLLSCGFWVFDLFLLPVIGFIYWLIVNIGFSSILLNIFKVVLNTCWFKRKYSAIGLVTEEITINNNSDGEFTVTTDSNNNALVNSDVLKNAYKLSKYARLCYESEEHIRKTLMAATDTPIIGTNAATTVTLTINNNDTNSDALTTNAATTVTLIANDDESDSNADNNEDTFTTNVTTTVTLIANENDSNKAVNDNGSNVNPGNNDNDNFKY